MLKIGQDSKIFKLVKNGTVKPVKQDSTSFLTQNANESFQNLKKAFCKKIVL